MPSTSKKRKTFSPEMEIGTASGKVSPRVGCFSEQVWEWTNRICMNVVKPGRRTPTLVLTLVGVVLVGRFEELGLLPLFKG